MLDLAVSIYRTVLDYHITLFLGVACNSLMSYEKGRQCGIVSELCQNYFMQLSLFERIMKNGSCGSNDVLA